MNAYDVCAACDCHVKSEEPCCPFCGAAREPRAPAGRPARWRVSRAEWLAFGSTLAVVGCTERSPVVSGSLDTAGKDGASDATWDTASDAPQADETSPGATPLDAADADAASNAGEPSDGAPDGVGDTAADGVADATPGPSTFRCAPPGADAETCEQGTQYCVTGGYLGFPGNCPAGCTSLDAGPITFGPAGFLAACDASPCRCLLQHFGTALDCNADNAGNLFVGCNPCYGSPPVRLEGMVASSRTRGPRRGCPLS